MLGNKCSDVMTSDLTCCTPTDTVHVAAQSMKSQDVGAMPVIDSHDKKRVIGMVTDRDLVLKVVAEDLNPRKTKVEDVMSVSYTHLRAHETGRDLVCRLLLE